MVKLIQTGKYKWIKRGFIVITVIIIIACISGYFYIYKSHRNIAKEKPVIMSTAIDFIKNHQKDVINKYLGKTIQVTGAVTFLDEYTLILNEQIYCSCSKKISKNDKTRKEITVKGRYVGYDDLLDEIKLDQCIIIN